MSFDTYKFGKKWHTLRNWGKREEEPEVSFALPLPRCLLETAKVNRIFLSSDESITHNVANVCRWCRLVCVFRRRLARIICVDASICCCRLECHWRRLACVCCCSLVYVCWFAVPSTQMSRWILLLCLVKLVEPLDEITILNGLLINGWLCERVVSL